MPAPHHDSNEWREMQTAISNAEARRFYSSVSDMNVLREIAMERQEKKQQQALPKPEEPKE